MLTTQQILKGCKKCGKTLKGRSDKKFCDDYCRSSFNNELKSVSNNLVRNINNALARNRRILENLLPRDGQKAKVNREKLIQQGFQFRYFTHTSTNRKGNPCYYCYEYGYLPLENNWLLLLKRDEEG